MTHDIQSLRSTKSNNYNNKILNILSNVFEYARKMGWLEINPVKMIDRPKPIINMPEPFTSKELEILLKNIESFYRGYQEMLFISGMRPLEVNKLTPSDLDLANKTLWFRNGNVNKSMAKNPQLIDDKVFKIISKQLEQAKKYGSKTLFFNKHGKPIHSRYYNEMVWKPLFEKAEIIKAGIHYRPIRLLNINPKQRKGNRLWEIKKDMEKNCIKTEEYLTVKELSERIKYAIQSIYNLIYQGEFVLGKHYLKRSPKKILFKWTEIPDWLGDKAYDQIQENNAFEYKKRVKKNNSIKNKLSEKCRIKI